MPTKTVFPLLLVYMFLAMLGAGLVIPILPQLLIEFGASGKAAGYLGLTQFLFSPIAGRFSDKYGRKPMIIGGLILFALSNLVGALASNFTVFLISRFIGGIGSAALAPSIMAYIVDITTENGEDFTSSWCGYEYG